MNGQAWASSDWSTPVAALREIRRVVVTGVVVKGDGGPSLQSWKGFYTKAHDRYHMLEDGYDRQSRHQA